MLFIVFFLFVGLTALIIWAVKRDNAKTDKIIKKANAILAKNPIIGSIEKTSHSLHQNESESKVLRLDKDIALYKYRSKPDESWVSFSIERKLKCDQVFSIERVVLVADGKQFESNLTLLFEKVPTHLAPPYGNRYFNIENYRPYILGGHIEYFRFESRFDFNLLKTKIKDSDEIRIQISIGNNAESKKIEFQRYFSESRYQKITQSNEDINWIN